MLSDQLNLKSIINEVNAPFPIKERFIRNYEHKDEMWNSVIAYETWMNQYYTRYDNFIKAVKKQLLENTDYTTIVDKWLLQLEEPKSQSQMEKIQYLISYDGLKTLEMSISKETRQYYIILEKCLQQLTEIQINDMHIKLIIKDQQRLKDQEISNTKLEIKDQEIMIKDQEIMIKVQELIMKDECIIAQKAEFDKHLKAGYIYKAFDTTRPDIFYIGQTISRISQRKANHKQSAHQALKSSKFLTYVFDLGWQQIQFEQVELVHYMDKQELNDREHHHIQELQPPLNSKK